LLLPASPGDASPADSASSGAPWLRALLVLTSAVAGVVFLVHAWYAVRSGHYISHVTGVWLALAIDARDGVFYRPLAGEYGYGGTRYFPLYFSLIGLLMHTGLGGTMAATLLMTGTVGALFSGVLVLLHRLEVGWWPALLLATAALTPYFVQQTIWELRGDVLATALTIWGLAGAAALLRRPSSTPALWLTAACFSLAFAAKITSLSGVAATCLAFWLAGRPQSAWKLAGLTAMGMGAVLAWMHLASGGVAYDVLRVCAFAGTTLTGTLRTMIDSGPFALTSGFRVLQAIFLPVAILLLLQLRRGWWHLPTLFLVASALTTSFVMASPGTALPNQVLELYVASLVFVGYVLRDRPRLAGVGLALVCLFLLGATRQVLVNVRQIDFPRAARELPAERQALLAAVDGFRGLVLSESPWPPVAAGVRPYVTDPFALRVAGQRFPGILEELGAQIDRQAFDYILLLEDPETAAGAGWYAHVHFGRPVIEAVRRHYEYRRTLAGLRVYAPVRSSERP
jgi:hypothetical protein